MSGWAVNEVGQGPVSVGVESLWTLARGFLAMDYTLDKYLLSFYYVAGTTLNNGDTVTMGTDIDCVLVELTA